MNFSIITRGKKCILKEMKMSYAWKIDHTDYVFNSVTLVKVILRN